MRSDPPSLLERLARRLFADRAECQAFIQAVHAPRVYDPHILWLRPRPTSIPFQLQSAIFPVEFVDRLALQERPTKHTLHAEGAYYSMSSSSLFAAGLLQAITNPVRTILDVCAAPGGKGIYAWRLFQPELSYFNEVIKKRLPMLVSNLKRCRIIPNRVLHRDSASLIYALKNPVDLVIVDAPCSGQSLIAEGEKNPGCFHPVTIKRNSGRQKRILGGVAKLVRSGGYLAYMTCTYAEEENEQVVEWFLKRHPGFETVAYAPYQAYQSHLIEQPAYRLWPQSGIGAGCFTVLLRKA